MKHSNYKKSILLLIVVILFFIAGSSWAQTPKKILVAPFQINAKEDHSFLKKGIADMLSSRLAQNGKVEVIGIPAPQAADEPKNVAEAMQQGQKLGADYVVFGSLTMFGNSISTDIRLIDLAQQQPVVVFSRFGKSQEEAIGHVDQFAGQVNEAVFGLKKTAEQPAVEKETVSHSRQHPEKLYEAAGGTTGDYAYDRPGGAPAQGFAIWRSRNYKMHIKGIAVGDVDGDKLNETVVIGDETVSIFRHVGGKFHKVAELKSGTERIYVSVDVADINGNGRAEIFVTAEERQRVRDADYISRSLQSFVLEWTGSQFDRILDMQKWYYRVTNVPGRGDILMGQRRGLDRLFSGKVYAMHWSSGTYEPAESQRLPQKTNIYSVAYGDIINSGKEMILGFTPGDYLRLYTDEGVEEWESGKPMGGSNIYFEYPAQGSTRDNTYPEEPEMLPYYISQRIIVTDFDGDGQTEAIVGNNRESFGRVFGGVRSFKSGHVECLFWDQLGLSPKWKTRSVSGYISDYFVADFDNDGYKELLFAVDTNPNPLRKSKLKSYLVSWKPKKPSAPVKK